MKKAIARYKAMQKETEVAKQPEYAGIPVTRPQGMWLVYLDMLGINWKFAEVASGEGKGPFETLMISLHGKGLDSVYAIYAPSDFSLRKYQTDIAKRMKEESTKSLLILGQAPEVLQAGVRKVSYIRRGRNGLFHEHAFINCKGLIQNLNNTTFANGFAALPKAATTAYLTYSTDNEELLEKHNRAAEMAWKWDFDKGGRCIEVEEPTAPAAETDKPQDDDITFITKGKDNRPDDPVFMNARIADVLVSATPSKQVRFTFTKEGAQKITDTDHIKVPNITADNTVFFMEGNDNDFKLSAQNSSKRPYRVQLTETEIRKRIIDIDAAGEYDLTQVTTKSGTKYWCVKLEAHHGK